MLNLCDNTKISITQFIFIAKILFLPKYWPSIHSMMHWVISYLSSGLRADTRFDLHICLNGSFRGFKSEIELSEIRNFIKINDRSYFVGCK